MRVEQGVVTVATPPALPLVRLSGDTVAAPTPNWAAGYTPVATDEVLVLLDGSGGRRLIGVRQ